MVKKTVSDRTREIRMRSAFTLIRSRKDEFVHINAEL